MDSLTPELDSGVGSGQTSPRGSRVLGYTVPLPAAGVVSHLVLQLLCVQPQLPHKRHHLGQLKRHQDQLFNALVSRCQLLIYVFPKDIKTCTLYRPTSLHFA